MEYERQQKEFQKDDIEGLTTEAEHRISEAQKGYSDSLEKERMKYQKDYNKESIKKLEEKVTENKKKYEEFCMTSNAEMAIVPVEEVVILKKLLQKETLIRNATEGELNHLKSQMEELKMWEASRESHISKLGKMLEDETHQKEKLKREIARLQSQLLQLGFNVGKTKQKIRRGGSEKVAVGSDYSSSFLVKHQQQASGNGEEASAANLIEHGRGLQKILSLLEAEDADAQIYAVKIIANLACEERNQKKIVEAGGIPPLLSLFKISKDETTHRVAASAIANLAMNESNQDLIAAQGGINLLSMVAPMPKILRPFEWLLEHLVIFLEMIDIGGLAYKIFTSPENELNKLQIKIRDEGGLKTLLGMIRCRHPDVYTQVARAIANFAKCESKASTQGTKIERSLLIVDGLLPWIVENAKNEVSLVRRHIEIALCHIAKYEAKANAVDMINGGAIRELVRVSRDSSREDIRILARETLISNSAFHAEIRNSEMKMVE
ncbi:vacuolar protein 8 [Vigna unguiculata]|uniref:Vacuolar protein 8 n=1 Tax=Vigna unguiculata TaxID=3917 RepID=A0A4D6L0Q8_VIGUN|nr:vacuolar protein 8 [Vigna unguiculata]